jgi:hypothetical protein
MGRVKRWLVVVAVVWGLVVLGLGYWSLRHGQPTAREQTTIGQALPTVDAALGDLAGVVDPATAVPVLTGYVQVGRSCSVTAAREGARYERILYVYTKPGTEPVLLKHVREALPERYKALLSKANVFSADAGNFVAVRGGVTAPGQVRFTADTGCRPQNSPVRENESPSADASRAPVQAVLDTLKLAGVSWQTHRAACPTGGTLWTVEADVAGSPPSLTDALKPGPDAIVARKDLVAYRSGPAGVVVRSLNGGLTITSTTGCQ